MEITAKEDADLIKAITRGDLDRMKKLIDGGADLNKTYDDFSQCKSYPLYWACRSDRASIVEFLLENDADPNVDRSMPILCYVCYERKPNCVEIVKLLLRHGACVNAQDLLTNNALIYTFMTSPTHRSVALMELLLEHGASVDHVNDFGRNALTFAINGGLSCVAPLLRHGSKVLPGTRTRLVKLIVTESTNEERYRLLRLAYEGGLDRIKRRKTQAMVTLPSRWEPQHHWLYSVTFKTTVKILLLVWQRIRAQRATKTLPRDLVLPCIRHLASFETKTRYHKRDIVLPRGSKR